jgi:hypothetical protein
MCWGKELMVLVTAISPTPAASEDQVVPQEQDHQEALTAAVAAAALVTEMI